MRKILQILFMLMPIISQAQLINFTWNETGCTQSGYTPGITIHEGESYQLKFSTSPVTSNVFGDRFNWVYYHFLIGDGMWVVEDESELFSISPNGIVTGKCAGLGAIKGTGFVQGANDRFYIEVIPLEEQEPNDNAEDAIELGPTAIPF